MRRLVRRREQRDLHQSERQHGRDQRHRPAIATSQPVPASSAAWIATRRAPSALFRPDSARSSAGLRTRSSTVSMRRKYYAITQEAARHAAPWPGTLPRPQRASGMADRRIGKRLDAVEHGTQFGGHTLAVLGRQDQHVGTYEVRRPDTVMPNWRQSRFRHSAVTSGPSA